MTEDELQTRVLTNLRTYRKKRGLTQEKLADKAGLSRQMMNDIEGRRRWLTKGTLVKLVNALEIDVHELFIPTPGESAQAKETYELIKEKAVAEIKEAVDRALSSV